MSDSFYEEVVSFCLATVSYTHLDVYKRQTMGFAVIMIFLVLAAQFNSFRDPFVILLGSVPLAMFGALLFTFLKMPNPQIPFPLTEGWTTTLNIYSKVGLVTLMGLIAKNGILIVEFANKLQLEGHAKLAAVREAALIRLRPILMTTAATIAGHLPLTLVTGCLLYTSRCV